MSPPPLALALALLVAHGPVTSLCAQAAATVTQRNRVFSAREITVDRGGSVHFVNADEFPHQIYARGPGISFDSGLQEPGEALDVSFPATGTVQVRCGVHPRMLLTVQVR